MGSRRAEFSKRAATRACHDGSGGSGGVSAVQHRLSAGRIPEKHVLAPPINLVFLCGFLLLVANGVLCNSPTRPLRFHVLKWVIQNRAIMPKAESSSRPSSPTKGSPSKRSRGITVPSFINVPYGIPASKLKLPALWTGKHKEESPKPKPTLFVTSIPKGKPPSGIFVSDDIFRLGQSETDSLAPDTSMEHALPASSPEVMDEDHPPFDFEDLRKALDDSALSSGLVGILRRTRDPRGKAKRSLRIGRSAPAEGCKS